MEEARPSETAALGTPAPAPAATPVPAKSRGPVLVVAGLLLLLGVALLAIFDVRVPGLRGQPVTITAQCRERDQKPEPCTSGSNVPLGAEVLLTLEAVADTHVMLFARDGTGEWRSMFPRGGAFSQGLGQGAKRVLSPPDRLTSKPGKVSYVLFFAPERFRRAGVQAAVTGKGQLPVGIDSITFELEKKGRP